MAGTVRNILRNWRRKYFGEEQIRKVPEGFLSKETIGVSQELYRAVLIIMGA